MTLNGVMALILRYFTQFGRFRGVKLVEDVVVKKIKFAISSHDAQVCLSLSIFSCNRTTPHSAKLGLFFHNQKGCSPLLSCELTYTRLWQSRRSSIAVFPYTNLISLNLPYKIDVEHYRDVLLMQALLPVIYTIPGDVFVFQQDNALAFRPHNAVTILL